MKTTYLIISLLLLASISLIGQITSEQVQFTNGTVKKGAVEKSRQFPYEIKLQEENQKQIQVLKSSDIQSLWDDFVQYESIIVEKGQKPILAKVLIKGKVNLYTEGKNIYIEKERKFYVLTKNDKEVEGGIQQDKKYIGMAKFLFFDCSEKSNNEWNNLRFSVKAFKKLVNSYNQCKNDKGQYLKNKKDLKKGVYIEGMSTTISTTKRFDPTPSFTVGIFGKIYNKNFLEMQIGLQLSMKNGERTVINSLNQRTVNHSIGLLEIPILLQKRIIRTKFNNGIFLNGGPVLGISLFKNTKVDFVKPELANYVDDRLSGGAFLGGRMGIGYLHRIKNGDLSINYFFERAYFGFKVGANIQNQGIRIAHIF